MIYAGLLLLLILGAFAYGTYQFSQVSEKPRDAVLTVAYLVCYPVAAFLVWRSEAGWWLLAPVIIAGIPWVFAGIYLNEIVRDPTLVREHHFVGFSYRYWLWGTALAVVTGMALD